VADTIVRLNIEPVQRAVLRSLEVVKSRGHEYALGRHTFRIINGQGLEVYRRVQAPRGLQREAGAAFDATTRVTTGVPGLDELVNGGYFVASTTLVVGISGAGKSVMALQYIAEGARRGERSLMITLDEPPAQVLRNARSIGIDLQSFIDRGLARPLHSPMLGCVFSQRQVCPGPIVVVHVLGEDLAKMPFADHDDVVKAFSPNRPRHWSQCATNNAS
jgi:KaiC/GvpD/RAD55 family RecA-like ATPase